MLVSRAQTVRHSTHGGPACKPRPLLIVLLMRFILQHEQPGASPPSGATSVPTEGPVMQTTRHGWRHSQAHKERGVLWTFAPRSTARRCVGMTVLLLAVAVIVAIVTAGEARAQADPSPPPRLADWSVGDLHVHAAGDSGLNDHARCGGLSDRSCARKVVKQTLDRAADNRLGLADLHRACRVAGGEGQPSDKSLRPNA